ncbi:hypothetical protein GCM10008101_20070 [Lysobacter xinjiangensis]|uniref:DUF1697 domain-containing protein n=1 Tax=Cognatilysobacter xinjiangensis TaxID=546892 RepID=A0ABQ3C3A6_9GAMM|nr:DUF1697 domain-containing protein [Lysobacter xinjiangensis]GGZ65978.1 hypothetical protein GCM10008101_20070 [Lysobacter xinjiangensis]
MSTWVALLHAVNVGGTGKLAMADLRRLCDEAGFRDARTYIASGNVVFDSDLDAADVVATLEAALLRHAGKPIRVGLRSADELAAVLAANPFADGAPSRVLAIFLPAPPPADAIETAKHRCDERIALGRREIYVDYANGIGTSKLVVPAAKAGTARNMNTVAKLVDMARG